MIAKIAIIFFPVSPKTIFIASANGALDKAKSFGEMIPIRAIEENI